MNTRDSANQDLGYGVFDVANMIAEELAQFIEASYHLKDDGLINERSQLLRDWGILRQRPYIEASPAFVANRRIAELGIPKAISAAIARYVGISGGFFDPPFEHQATALEAFFQRKADIIVATGTGSGKTEAFFMPIVGSIEREMDESPKTASLNGMRAILLYPMNALVNDQVTRLRRLLSNDARIKEAVKRRGRPIRFASYTGRTPYPGPRTAAKDTQYVAPLFEDFYLPLLESDAKRELLRSVGRWPAKDLKGFYSKDLQRETTFRSGKKVGQKRVVYNWDDRLRTQQYDAELLTRHEALLQCPDILITNYSMLEYMLLRPLEKGIFDDTARWLNASTSNELILVIDEAHLYRGAAGAEVGLLIRRLIARLGVPRERIRVIITSASIGEGQDGETAAVRFAEDLTGSPKPRSFEVVRSVTESHEDSRSLSRDELNSLASFHTASLEASSARGSDGVNDLQILAAQLRVQPPSLDEGLDTYLGQALTQLPFVRKLLHSLGAGPVSLEDLTQLMCESDEANAEKALAALLALCSTASRPDGRKLLSARLHLFVRGLPALWACCDAACDVRRVTDGASILGRLYVGPIERCTCKRGARVFELLSHRDCGAAFLRGYVTSIDSHFVWSEAGTLPDAMHPPRKLRPIEILVDGDPHERFGDGAQAKLLDIRTGRIATQGEPGGDFRRVWVPSEQKEGEIRFHRCPVCLAIWRSQQSAIEPHSTVGEGTFSVATRAQLRAQPEGRPRPDQLAELDRYPNKGRKVLVFSDGRQRAAKLARVMPELAEQDAFRQALLAAAGRLGDLGRQPLLTNSLYTAFVQVVAESGATFFAGASQRELAQHIAEYRRHGLTLEDALEEPFDRRPLDYDRALLKALGGRNHSMEALALAYVEPSDAALRQIRALCQERSCGVSSEAVRSLAIIWISEALRDFSFDERLTNFDRRSAARYYRDAWGIDTKKPETSFSKSFRDAWKRQQENEKLGELAEIFLSTLSVEGAAGQYFLNPRQLKITNAVDSRWFRCTACQAVRPVTLEQYCASCLLPRVTALEPEDPYLKARKDFWRDPVRRAMKGLERIETMVAAEHTAQLSHRDRASVYSTTERHELLFQDILMRQDDRPIDVLSCTTTMEVGIDIGALVAVGLRNIPPERSNYQQRAGRAGRRGANVSTVLAFADRGPHDSYYFAEPKRIISGPPRTPEIKIDNQKLVRRHIHAFVLQRFFANRIDAGITTVDSAATLEAALGPTYEFFRDASYGANLAALKVWLSDELENGSIVSDIVACLPRITLQTTIETWIQSVCISLTTTFDALMSEVPLKPMPQEGDGKPEVRADALRDETYPRQLLEFCSSRGLLPTYALPVDLASFVVDAESFPSELWRSVRIVEQPQQDMGKALSEYAPGRIVTINGVDYRSGSVATSAAPFTKDRAVALFRSASKMWFCPVCSAIRVNLPEENQSHICLTCTAPLKMHLVLQPEVFYPENRDGVSEDDRAQERTYATGAQLPLPADEEDLPPFAKVGERLSVTHASDHELVSVNKGLHAVGEDSGFWVCRFCGYTRLDPKDLPKGTHIRPYVVEGPRDKDASLCKGSFERVYLGRRFRTDLLVLRFLIEKPLITDLHSVANVILLETAFTTISQAITIATSRHKELDLDPQEFGSGYRFVPNHAGGLGVDVYLHDTLSGGAGYADMAGQYINEILVDALDLLDHCAGNCPRSCPQCLRHFRNQHVTERLDRKIGAQMLRYAMYGQLPVVSEPGVLLEPLTRWLTSDECSVTASEASLLIAKGAYRCRLDVVPALIGTAGGPSSPGVTKLELTDFALDRDLPHCHMIVRQTMHIAEN